MKLVPAKAGMMTRELAFDPGLEPLSALSAPARGAVTVAAGAIDDVRPPTLFTCIGCRAGLLGPAYRDRMNGFSMLEGMSSPKRSTVSAPKVRKACPRRL